MNRYSVIPLSKIAQPYSGGTPSKSEPSFWGGNIPWLTPKDMGLWNGSTEESVSESAIGNGTRLAPAGAVFIAVRGMSLHNEIRIIRSEEALTFNQDIKALVPKEGVDGRFLYFALVARKKDLLDSVESAGHGTGRLPTDLLESVSVPDIDPSVQVELGLFFGAIEDKINLNQQMNKTMEAVASSLFREWFVDFGPVRAKSEGQPGYLSESIWSLFPAKFDAYGKPEGWEASKIGIETNCVGGGTPPTSNPEYWGGGINWATPKDLSRLKTPVLLSTERTISAAGLDKISSGLLPVGAVLLSSRAPIGYIAIAECPVAVNQGFIAMKCEGRLSNLFVWQWLRANMDAILQQSNGSTFQEISKTNFRPLPVIVASEQLLSEFDRAIRPLYEQIRANEVESQALANMRDMLLPVLMSGEAVLEPLVRAS